MDAEVAFAHLITWGDDTVAGVRMYTSEAAALEAAGLSE
jgi:hypothetical protein